MARGLDSPRVGAGLGEQGGALRAPGLLSLGQNHGLGLLLPSAPGLLAPLGLTPLQEIGGRHDEERHGADPGQSQEQEDEVEREPSRQRSVGD